jgi:D-arginine dehydrogenase
MAAAPVPQESTMSETADVLIVGAGMAGASAAYFLARDGLRVALLERERQPGYHSTGRSAALFSEAYGPSIIRRLSRASRAFLEQPPEGFVDAPVLTPRGRLTVGQAHEADAVAAWVREGHANGVALEHLDGAAVERLVPILRKGRFTSGAYEPDAKDVDVHTLHWGFLRGIRRAGSLLRTDSEAEQVERRGGVWHVRDRSGERWEAPLLVNAAGAWADELAARAGVAQVGLVPKRRTAVMVDLPDLPVGTALPWPLTDTMHFYFRPHGGRLMLCPADATPVPPQDVQPEVEDVAGVLETFREATGIDVERPGEAWAGLRSFVSDGNPVCGYADDAEGFFWLAGQGGYGIQTSAGLGMTAAALVQGKPLPQLVQDMRVRADALAPDRPALRR